MLERTMRVNGLNDKERDNYFSDMMTEKESTPTSREPGNRATARASRKALNAAGQGDRERD